jgi:hypothetical protein
MPATRQDLNHFLSCPCHCSSLCPLFLLNLSLFSHSFYLSVWPCRCHWTCLWPRFVRKSLFLSFVILFIILCRHLCHHSLLFVVLSFSFSYSVWVSTVPWYFHFPYVCLVESKNRIFFVINYIQKKIYLWCTVHIYSIYSGLTQCGIFPSSFICKN